MEFTIAEKPLDALKNDLTLYHRLSLKLRTSCASDVVLHSRLEQLFEAELSDILSLLYYGSDRMTDSSAFSGNVELMCLYDDLISYIADHDTHDDAMMLYDYDFWDLYFGFYEQYHLSNTISNEKKNPPHK